MVRYNQVKGIKKSGSTDQSVTAFLPSQQHIAIASLLYHLFRLCQVVKIPNLKLYSIHKLGLLNPNSAYIGVFV